MKFCLNHSFVWASGAFFAVVAFCLLAACTTDSSYDPSSKYEGKDVDYQVTSVPICTKKLEGKVFYEHSYNVITVCAEGEWVVLRKFKAWNDPELDLDFDRLPFYKEDDNRDSRDDDDDDDDDYYYDSRNNDSDDDYDYDDYYDDYYDGDFCIYNPSYCEEYGIYYKNRQSKR